MRDINTSNWFDLAILKAQEVFEKEKSNWIVNNNTATQKQKNFVFALLDSIHLDNKLERYYLEKIDWCYFDIAEKIISELKEIQKTQNSEFDYFFEVPKWKKRDFTGSLVYIHTEKVETVADVERINDGVFYLNFSDFKYLKITDWKKPFMYPNKNLKNRLFECIASEKRDFKTFEKGFLEFMI